MIICDHCGFSDFLSEEDCLRCRECRNTRPKPKRTISVEAYIKMQNDWAISCRKLHEDRLTVPLDAAKETIDSILKFNNVEVE